MRTPHRVLLAALSLFCLPGFTSAAGDLQCRNVEASTLATIDTGDDDFPNALVEMRLRPDGRPVILYSGGPMNSQSMRLIDCHDERCETYTDNLVASAFNYNDALGLALAADGRPLILANHFGKLTYFECSNAACSLSRSVQIEPVFPGGLRSVLVKPDGRPQLVYAKGSNADTPYDIISYTCADSRCASGVKKMLLDVSPAKSLTLGATTAFDGEGRLVLSFLQNSGAYFNTDVRVLTCGDTDCATAETHTVSSRTGYRYALFAWMRLLADGRPLLLNDLSSSTTGEAFLTECADGRCVGAASRDVPTSPGRVLLGLGVHDLDRPLAGTLTNATAGLYVCNDADCTDADVKEVPATKPYVRAASLQIGPATTPKFAYFDESATRLRLLQCEATKVFANGYE